MSYTITLPQGWLESSSAIAACWVLCRVRTCSRDLSTYMYVRAQHPGYPCNHKQPAPQILAKHGDNNCTMFLQWLQPTIPAKKFQPPLLGTRHFLQPPPKPCQLGATSSANGFRGIHNHYQALFATTTQTMPTRC